jgi:uronate dehydrogenase
MGGAGSTALAFAPCAFSVVPAVARVRTGRSSAALAQAASSAAPCGRYSVARRIMRRLVITGAAGRIGSVLRRGLRDVADELRLVDIKSIDSEDRREEPVTADLASMESALAALQGADAVIHLAGIPSEDAFERLLQANFTATYNVFEAARIQSVRRVVFASSNHATGMYPVGARIGPDDPVRPDSLYGISKVFGESLGRLHADKHGLEVVCLRIGSFAERPTHWRELYSWLSPADAVALFRASLLAAEVSFTIAYGVSGNTRGWWDTSNARRLGYAPRDDAERFVSELEQPDRGDEFQGGPYAASG